MATVYPDMNARSKVLGLLNASLVQMTDNSARLMQPGMSHLESIVTHVTDFMWECSSIQEQADAEVVEASIRKLLGGMS